MVYVNFPGVNWQMHHELLCKLVRNTPVGTVLESVESDNCEEFYKLYLHDFVMGVHRCKHSSSDLTAMEVQVSTLSYRKKYKQ